MKSLWRKSESQWVKCWMTPIQKLHGLEQPTQLSHALAANPEATLPPTINHISQGNQILLCISSLRHKDKHNMCTSRNHKTEQMRKARLFDPTKQRHYRKKNRPIIEFSRKNIFEVEPRWGNSMKNEGEDKAVVPAGEPCLWLIGFGEGAMWPPQVKARTVISLIGIVAMHRRICRIRDDWGEPQEWQDPGMVTW